MPFLPDAGQCPQANGLGWGRMPRVPAHPLISRSIEVTRTNSGAGHNPALTWVLPLPSLFHCPGRLEASKLNAPKGPAWDPEVDLCLKVPMWVPQHPTGSALDTQERFQEPEPAQPLASHLACMVVACSTGSMLPSVIQPPTTPALLPDPAGG